jgi:hypothetical protein
MSGRTTKEQRRLSLMSTFGTVVDAACCTIGKTKALLEILTDHMKELTIQDVSSNPQVAEPPAVMSTLGTAAAAATVNEEEDETTSLAFLVHPAANPKTAKNQKQKRIQPQSGGPTAKGYKAKARQGARKRNDSVKKAENRAQGNTTAGKKGY